MEHVLPKMNSNHFSGNNITFSFTLNWLFNAWRTHKHILVYGSCKKKKIFYMGKLGVNCIYIKIFIANSFFIIVGSKGQNKRILLWKINRRSPIFIFWYSQDECTNCNRALKHELMHINIPKSLSTVLSFSGDEIAFFFIKKNS